MKLTVVSMAVAVASAYPHEHFKRGAFDTWTAPSDTDLRGPCPMMNTLANHDFLQHDGDNITLERLTYALNAALGFDASLANTMFEAAVDVNPVGNGTWFSLGNLNRHNVLEHDASMTRGDAFFGSNHAFNQTIFDETKQYWPDDLMTAEHLTNGKLARQVNSRALNPEYTFTTTMEQFSLGEVSAPIVAFGSFETYTTNRTLVEYWIQNERFPTELGWTKRNESVTLEKVSGAAAAIGNLTSLFTTGTPVVTDKRRSVIDSHFGKLSI